MPNSSSRALRGPGLRGRGLRGRGLRGRDGRDRDHDRSHLLIRLGQDWLEIRTVFLGTDALPGAVGTSQRRGRSQ